jgi:ribosomal protein S19E (S16A)
VEKTTMKKYEKLDAAIMRKIKLDGLVSFGRLFTGDVHKQCVELAWVDEKDNDEAFRYLDRRLQSLRKSGLIQSTSRGWGLTND